MIAIITIPVAIQKEEFNCGKINVNNPLDKAELHSFPTTTSCLSHLKKNGYVSMVTSPHIKGRANVILENGEYTQKKVAIWFGNEISWRE